MAYIHEFNKPIPVVTLEGEKSFAIYVKDSGQFENDEWCVCLCNNGVIRHFMSNQIRIQFNGTFEIIKTV